MDTNKFCATEENWIEGAQDNEQRVGGMIKERRKKEKREKCEQDVTFRRGRLVLNSCTTCLI